MSVFKDFPGVENLEKKFRDFEGPTRALLKAHSVPPDPVAGFKGSYF